MKQIHDVFALYIHSNLPQEQLSQSSILEESNTEESQERTVLDESTEIREGAQYVER